MTTDGVNLGQELESRRLPSRVEEFLEGCSRQFLLLGLVFVGVFAVVAPFESRDDAVVVALLVSSVVTLLVCLTAWWDRFRLWVGHVESPMSSQRRRIQLLANHIYASWRDGSVPAQVGLVGEARRTPQQDAALKEAFESQRDSSRRFMAGPELRRALGQIDLRERFANQIIPGLTLYYNEETDRLYARVVVWPPVQPEQVVAAIPDLERAWGVCIGDSESSGGEVLMPIYLRERAGWAR